MNGFKRRYCNISSCVNMGPAGRNEPLFGLPMDISLRDQWVHNIRNYGSTASPLNYNFRICRLHFDLTDIVMKPQNGIPTASLASDAVPKYFDSKPVETEIEEIVMNPNLQIKSINLPKQPDCVECIQSDVELQEIRVKITQLENRLEEKTAETTSLLKMISLFKSARSNNAPNIEQCTVCQENFTEVEIFSHSCLENGQELRCQYCARSFKATIKLLEHLRIFHDEKQFYDCDHCPRQFEMAELLKIHSQIHPAESKPKFPCEDCDKTFFLQLRLDQHIDLEHSESIHKLFKCGICGKSFNSGKGLKNHITSVHVIKPKVIKLYPYECYICKQRMQSMSELQMHLRTNHRIAIEKRTEKCKICDRKSFTKTEMDKHLCKSEDESIGCEYCSERFTSVLKLEQHIESRHPINLKIYKCLKCTRQFLMKTLLDYHDSTHFKKEKKHICDICSKAFNKRGNLKHHLELHMMENTHLCDECGKAFKTEYSLSVHKKTHNEPTHQCPDCPRRFRNIAHYRIHQDIHRNVKYVCNICNAELGTLIGWRSHLKNHKRTEADRCFQCTQCPQKFFNGKRLRRHAKIVHTMIKKFQCTYCDAAYKHSTNLNKHLRTHLGDDIYHCPDCPERFRSPKELRTHSFEHYKDNKQGETVEMDAS